MNAKLLAEWFWTDRWNGSSAFLLPMEARGVYREMLTQAWRRGARLPNDLEMIQRAIGCTAAEWNRSWPKVKGYWRVDGDSLVNDTQLEVYAECQRISKVRAIAGAKGGASTQAKRVAKPVAKPQANTTAKIKPPDLDLNPDLTLTPDLEKETAAAKNGGGSKITWLTPFGEIWKRRYGGRLAFGEAAKCLRVPVQELGTDAVQQRLDRYCLQVTGQFASISRFAQTIGQWNGSQPPVGQTAAEKTAAASRQLMREAEAEEAARAEAKS